MEVEQGLIALSKDIDGKFGVYRNFRHFQESIESREGWCEVKIEGDLTLYRTGNEYYIVRNRRVFTIYGHNGKNVFRDLQSPEGRAKIAEIGNELRAIKGKHEIR